MKPSAESATGQIATRCCIVGGGPAGMMTGMLLARSGVEVVVLEKHADFLRDFRGDTIHPSTMEVMHELGWLEAFLQRPHERVEQLTGFIEGEAVPIADFTHLPVQAPYIALMPQWDFLNFVMEQGKRFPGFQVRMEAEVDDVIREGGRIAGVTAKTPQGRLEVRSQLTIGADGRGSTARARAGLTSDDLGAPMDVLWFRLPRREGDPAQVLGRFSRGRIMVMLDRGAYWQCGFVISKDGNERVRARGLDAFRRDLDVLVPWIADRTGTLQDWDQVKLLTVKVDRLRRWHVPGLLCIGDAAHAMSPVGGVGINLAIQDAVAAANVLAPAFRRGMPTERDLAAVQRRRSWPTRATQWLQVRIQNRVIAQTLRDSGAMKMPWVLRQFQRHPWLRRGPARVIGLGIRPEHVW
ncbi:FAD-dependent oxidoreductase [Horticoccus luteus]|uniref:FAD-dependent oxidoreductase n=1 Tax=Horticoccus luteus TaxID=2862869 RepID=A0A8F9TYP4_9BACT|nr:FAD-dependent oxidoreductase [Horticoccus luteus]QYM80436.1 FAD-dependent oxidoreductase [Horticoccus luteus]